MTANTHAIAAHLLECHADRLTFAEHLFVSGVIEGHDEPYQRTAAALDMIATAPKRRAPAIVSTPAPACIMQKPRKRPAARRQRTALKRAA